MTAAGKSPLPSIPQVSRTPRRSWRAHGTAGLVPNYSGKEADALQSEGAKCAQSIGMTLAADQTSDWTGAVSGNRTRLTSRPLGGHRGVGVARGTPRSRHFRGGPIRCPTPLLVGWPAPRRLDGFDRTDGGQHRSSTNRGQMRMHVQAAPSSKITASSCPCVDLHQDKTGQSIPIRFESLYARNYCGDPAHLARMRVLSSSG